jgi:hypothetical protein
MVVRRFEAELARQLRPVEAPAELWTRIQRGEEHPPMAGVRWPVWAFAAALAAMVALCCFHLRSETGPYLAQLASGVTADRWDKLEFPSQDPAAIRSWLKTQTGMDIPVPQGASVRLTGANVFRNGKLVACVSYRVGGRIAKLFVARGESGAPRHPAVQEAPSNGVALASWSMHGQSYVLAAPEVKDLHAACILCHTGGAGPKITPRA